jgi:hypothetical protein
MNAGTVAQVDHDRGARDWRICDIANRDVKREVAVGAHNKTGIDGGSRRIG